MPESAQQEHPTRGNHFAVSALVAGVAAVAVVAAAGCECAPARSKPWRNAPDPAVTAASVPSSEVVQTESARVETRRRRGHTLRIHMDAQPRHLNPMVSPSLWTNRIAFDTVFETLIRYEPPEGGAGAGPGHYRPGLASAWRIGPGHREIRIDLEPDVRFHDGKRMTSVDVQFSLDAARSLRLPTDHLRAELADVVAVELINSKTLRIRLSRPNAYALRALAEVPILPAHVYENRLSAKRGAPVVGTGPYRLASWEGDVVHLTRNDGYWGPAPAIADIEFIYEPDAARALTVAKRGDLDFIPALIPAHYPEQASAPGLAASFDPIRLRPPQLRFLAMNASRPPLDDARVRHALNLLIDRKALVKEHYNGLARAISGPVWPGGPGDGPAPAPPAEDPAAAAKLLDAAGWRDRDGDGTRERDGQRLRLALLALDTDNPDRDQVITNLRRSGIGVEQRVGTPAVLRNRLASGAFDLAFVEWRSAVDRDLAALIGTGGADNHGGFSSRRVDAALTALRGAWEPGSRAPLMAELARAVADEWPMAALVTPDPYGLLHRRVHGAVVWNGWIELRALRLADADDAE